MPGQPQGLRVVGLPSGRSGITLAAAPARFTELVAPNTCDCALISVEATGSSSNTRGPNGVGVVVADSRPPADATNVSAAQFIETEGTPLLVELAGRGMYVRNESGIVLVAVAAHYGVN